MPDTRIPTQKRSIEKRNKIIEKGFELMCEAGYYNTNTNQIAEYAGVSTGIIYQYFKDKKEIFIEGVKNYSDKIMYPMLSILETEKMDVPNWNNLDSILRNILNKFMESHTISQKAHEELLAMSHLDEDVAAIFKNSELKVTAQIVSFLEDNNIQLKNGAEKIHLIISMMDNLCHEMVYHKHESIDYNIMTEEVINLIITLLTDSKGAGQVVPMPEI